MNRLLSTIVAVSIAVGVTAVEIDPITTAYNWAVTSLEQIRVHEEKRQNEIQQVVCEMNSTSPCPTVTLAPTVITEEP